MLVNSNNSILKNSNNKVFEFVQNPLKIKGVEPKFIICPDWQTGNYDLTPKVHNQPCDGLYDFVSGLWVTESDIAKRPLWRKDTTFNKKWYVKFDGINDRLINDSLVVSPIVSVFLIVKVATVSLARTIYAYKNNNVIKVLNNNIRYYRSPNPINRTYPLSGNYLSILYSGLDNPVINAKTISESSTSYGLQGVPGGISIGTENNTEFCNMELAFLGLYDNLLSEKTIQGLMNFGKIEFGAGKNYRYGS
jgi:hypothetical protein